ncbi:protein TAPT1 homolog isoform X2 [Ischnura elegans]|uniref:protein TAPT1 homolog isoform X2 n=1 Tax=Ischnura elegans TaxID=197161 RepID=UPI001ED8B0DA|nr:protein TAPT1 homolog isoform X2 [Ischnura elegans]
MSSDYADGTVPERKIRFMSTTKIHYSHENKVEDLLEDEETKNGLENEELESSGVDKVEKRQSTPAPSLFQFLKVELTRGYLLEHDEERYSARREKVYSFLKIPREVEKFMAYGFFQCADSFLFAYTFLPLRFILALWAVISRPILGCFGVKHLKSRSILTPAEICDLLKASILISCSMMMLYIDTSMMYHLIKSQSVIKLYIFYNMLEVGDRLFSAFGQDTIDALFWTATEPRDRKREHLGVIPHLLFAASYVFLHSLLVLFQATTLNVAINSNNKALLTIMMSNNFVELKGSVFKKFDKNNLFQVSCSDVRERFHLFVLLFIVVLQTMKEYSWKEERFWVLVPDCMMVLLAEVLVDWIKHAFITRFNELPVDVYRDYTLSLAYDMAQTRQKHAFSDHSDLVARRMGFIPLPLGVVMVRVLAHAIRIEGPAAIALLLLSYLCLASFRVLNGLVILGKACDLISQHRTQREAAAAAATAQSSRHSSLSGGSLGWIRTPEPLASRIDNATPHGYDLSNGIRRRKMGLEERKSARRAFMSSRKLSLPDGREASKSTDVSPSEIEDENRPPSTEALGPAAIFSNSAVCINSVCMNEELLAEEPIKLNSPEKSGIEDMKNISGSTSEVVTSGVSLPSECPLSKKKSGSEPAIPQAVEEVLTDTKHT